MARAGYFPAEELKTLRKFGSRLQGHPHRLMLPGLETSSGPLGSGLSQAAGMAYAFRLDKKKSDNMLNERRRVGLRASLGSGALGGENKLDNLTAIIDRNNIQIDGFTEDIMP